MAGAIIGGVDDSDAARDTMRVARELSDRFRRQLVLVHVAPGGSPPATSTVRGGRSSLARAERSDAEESLLADVAAAAGLGHGVERRVVFGDPADILADIARPERADLVVVGSRGGGPVAAALAGSVSQRFARAAPCPVVIVPPRAETGEKPLGS